MTVSELIEELRKLPQNSMVVVNGYEGGVKSVDFVDETVVALNVNTEWYYGEHEIYDREREYPDLSSYDKVPAVWLGGK